MSGYDQRIAGRSGPRLAARVYKPQTGAPPFPVIILATGIGTVKENRTMSFVKPFVENGYACITFDYATWGGSEGEPRHLIDPSHQYRDVCNVVAWVRDNEAFDPSKVIIWGSSFGGLHVTQLLAEDHGIAAGIAQCPCVDARVAARMKPITTTLQIGFWAICDVLGSLIGREPIYIRIARMPDDTIGGPALMEAEGVPEGYRHVIESSTGPLRNKAVARSGLSIPLHQPRKLAAKIVAPYLLCLPEFDNVAPLDVAKEMSKRIAKAEVVTIPGGHFDLYEGKIGFEKNIEAQLEFLRRIIPTGNGSKL